MARPAFAGRRARSRAGQLAAFGAVVLLVAAALAVLGGAIAPVLDSGSRTVIAQSGATSSAMRIQTRLSDDPAAQDETIRAAFDTALRGLPAEVIRTVSGDATATVDGDPVDVQVLVDPELSEVADLADGAWPTHPDQTAIQDAAAAALNLRVGDTLAIGDVDLTVTGIWTADDPAASRWFGDPAAASGAEDGAAGPLLVDESVAEGLAETAMARWTMVPDPSALGVGSLPAYADSLARLHTEVRRMGGGNTAVTLLGTLDDTVARATRVTAVAGGVLGLPLVLVAVAGAIVLTLIARALGSGRGGEFVLLRARGASRPALTAAAARESGVTAAIGGAIGAGVAVLVLRFGLPAVGAEAGVPVPLVIGIAAAVAALATVLATVVTVAELRAPVTGRAEAGRAAVIAALGPLALAIVAAGLALAQFLSLGSPVVVRDGIVRTDPVALTAPVLVLLAAALAAPAIAGPIVAVAERFARAGRGILPVLPLRQLARRSRSVAAGVLVIALATGAAGLAVAFHLAATDARLHAERAATGEDLRVVLPLRSTVEPGHAGASADLVTGVDGVDDAFAVLETTASIGSDAVPLLAADAERLAGSFTDELTAARGGSALPDGTTVLTVHAELAPSSGVPADLTIGVLLWLADADGAALRVPLGGVPLVEGEVEITGDIPASAVSLIAVQFEPPALPPSTIVDVVLDEVTTPGGGAVAIDGSTVATLTSGKNARISAGPGGLEPLPVVAGAELAERLGVGVGTEFTFRVSSVPQPISARVIGIAPEIPGAATSFGAVIDLLTLEARTVELGGSVPAANELWASAADPDAVAVAVRAALTSRSEIVTPQTRSPGPVLDPTLLLVELGVAVTVLLAILGFAAVAASIAHRRRVELTPLRSLGLSVARVRSARAIELVATAVLAVLLGAAAGLLTAALVVPGLVAVLA